MKKKIKKKKKNERKTRLREWRLESIGRRNFSPVDADFSILVNSPLFYSLIMHARPACIAIKLESPYEDTD